MIGLDGSEEATAALKWAIKLAQVTSSRVTAVHAIDIPPLYSAPMGLPFTEDRDWQAGIRDEFESRWCAPLKTSGLQYQTVMEVGRAASVIAAVAERVNADLVVVGRRGRGGVAELLLGSVSHEVVLHCRRPVVVISRSP